MILFFSFLVRSAGELRQSDTLKIKDENVDFSRDHWNGDGCTRMTLIVIKETKECTSRATMARE